MTAAVLLTCFMLGVIAGMVTMQMIPTHWGQSKPKQPTVRALHMRPSYSGYKGGYTQINRCVGCGMVGMYEDLHEARCCPKCGGGVVRYGSGAWLRNTEGRLQWMKP